MVDAFSFFNTLLLVTLVGLSVYFYFHYRGKAEETIKKAEEAVASVNKATTQAATTFETVNDVADSIKCLGCSVCHSSNAFIKSLAKDFCTGSNACIASSQCPQALQTPVVPLSPSSSSDSSGAGSIASATTPHYMSGVKMTPPPSSVYWMTHAYPRSG